MLLDHRVPHPRGEPVVDVVAAERQVARVRDQRGSAGRAVHDRAVEGAAAEVVDERALAARPAREVGVRRGERLLEQPHLAEPGARGAASAVASRCGAANAEGTVTVTGAAFGSIPVRATSASSTCVATSTGVTSPARVRNAGHPS